MRLGAVSPGNGTVTREGEAQRRCPKTTINQCALKSFPCFYNYGFRSKTPELVLHPWKGILEKPESWRTDLTIPQFLYSEDTLSSLRNISISPLSWSNLDTLQACLASLPPSYPPLKCSLNCNLKKKSSQEMCINFLLKNPFMSSQWPQNDIQT